MPRAMIEKVVCIKCQTTSKQVRYASYNSWMMPEGPELEKSPNCSYMSRDISNKFGVFDRLNHNLKRFVTRRK